MENRDKRSKGCGIVEYKFAEDAAKAIEELHDTYLDGRQIFVREDREIEGKSGGNYGKCCMCVYVVYMMDI